MSALAEIRARWQSRRATYAESTAQVDGARLVDLFLADLDALEHARHAESVSLKEAALLGGYSYDHLQRLVERGEIENVGRKGKPRIRRVDVPVKPGRDLRSDVGRDQLAERRRIVASVATPSTEAS